MAAAIGLEMKGRPFTDEDVERLEDIADRAMLLRDWTLDVMIDTGLTYKHGPMPGGVLNAVYSLFDTAACLVFDAIGSGAEEVRQD